MKVCPKCQKEFKDYEFFCPYCGTRLLDGTSMDSSKVAVSGDANAISAHIDSHNVQNIIEAQKSDAERAELNERQFQEAVKEKYLQSNLDSKALAELELLRDGFHISKQRADDIIQSVRANMEKIHDTPQKAQAMSDLIREVEQAIRDNNIGALEREMGVLEQYVPHSPNSDITFYYNLLVASFTPRKLSKSSLKSNSYDYWGLFWTAVSFLKQGDQHSANAMHPRLASYDAPYGNMLLMTALDYLFEYGKNQLEYCIVQVRQQLDKAERKGISGVLKAFFSTLKNITEKPSEYDDLYDFYCQYTLNGILPSKSKIVQRGSSSSRTVLPQMQGFDPIQAANTLHLGEMPDMLQTQYDLKTIGRIADVPQMGKTMPDKLIMPDLPDIPPIPSQSEQPEQCSSKAKSTPKPSKFSAEAILMAESARESYDELANDDPLVKKEGIILTNSVRLAEKYRCPRQEIIDLFNVFIDSSLQQEMTWHLLDAYDHANLLGDKPTWRHYNDLVTLFINQNNLQTGIGFHLFIIGGDDVIPVPIVIDPYENGTGSIPCDMCYSFEGTYIPDMLDGELGEICKECVRNSVARLPLEDGVLSTDLQGDIGAYLNLCTLFPKGIPVGNVVMTSNSKWIPASTTMSEHLPLLFNTEDPELIRNGMYISPKLITCDQQSLDIYCKSLKDADMLMFNLHGDNSPERSGFYNDYDEAFNVDLLNRSNARVLNTVACFGARYVEYLREESILLSSLYGGGILLYTGSLVSVPMYYNIQNPENNEVRALLFNPGTGSEVFMRLYSIYLFKGIPAGQALLQAKCDYYNMCRHVEDDGFSLSTILMFSLYGNPMLHVKELSHVIDSALENDAMPPAPVKSVPHRLTKKNVTPLFKKSKANSLLEQVQAATDSNFAHMRKIVEITLNESYGITSEMLYNISEFESFSEGVLNDAGYFFYYHNPNRHFSSDFFVEVDKQGTIKRIYTTK